MRSEEYRGGGGGSCSARVWKAYAIVCHNHQPGAESGRDPGGELGRGVESKECRGGGGRLVVSERQLQNNGWKSLRNCVS